MAVLLIMGENHTHADPDVDAAGCYKIGDIVTVNEDTAHDGDIVRNPIAPGCYVMKIVGVTRSQVEKYVQSHVDDTAPRHPTVLRRRLYRVRVADVPQAIKTVLQRDRYIELTWAQIRGYVRNKVTGLDE